MSKISELTDGGSLLSTDTLIAVRSGGNVKVQADTFYFDQIDLGDNEKIRLGNSQDLEIYHSTSGSIINDNGTGSLKLQQGGSTKLEVTTTGIDVTGSVVSDGITSDGNITLGAGYKLQFNADRYFTPENNIDGAEVSSNYVFRIKTGLTPVARFLVTGDGDISFYDTSQSQAFYWDASAASLGIGTTPSYPLDVLGPSTISGRVKTSGALNAFYMEDSGTTANTLYIGSVGNDWRVVTGSFERLRVDSSGLVGIGTSAPATALDVVGTVTADGLTVDGTANVKSSGGKSTISIGDTAASTYAQLLLYGGATKYNWMAAAQYNSDNAFEITPSTATEGVTFSNPALRIDSNRDISFFDSAGSSQALLWDSSAESLGIGTLSPSQALDVVGNIGVSGDVELGAYNATIADTAVDVFVYDTSKDSDGGAWRHRTQHTSWYNETLNTSTRGSRKEFPAVAVIVSTSTSVTIYDGDDPDLPMWMVFSSLDRSNGIPAVLVGGAGLTPRGVQAKNGTVYWGNGSVSYGGLIEARFISDTGKITTGAGWSASYDVHANIAQRNATATNTLTAVAGPLVDKEVNDIAVTVLPDAPIDDATGLPVPTIAVATDGGVSVIKDDGTIFNPTGATYDEGPFSFNEDFSFALYSRNAAPTKSVFTSSNTAVMATSGGNYVSVADIDFRNNSQSILAYLRTSTPDFFNEDANGISSLHINGETFADSMVALTTPEYATGYQVGDIKLATLSDTDDTDVTGSELVTNGTFDTDLTGWTSVNATWVSGAINCANGNFYQTGIFTGTKTVRISWDQTVNSGTRARLRLRNAANNADVGPFNYYIGTGSKSINVSTSDGLTLWFFVEAADDLTFDNISVVEVDADRSVNNNGLIVNGTITKDPVATGADLVAYSGFSTSNYLEQPYNSDLDFGTGDFCVMGWVQESAASDWLIDRMEGRDGSSNLWGFNIWQSTQSLRLDLYENNAATSVTATTVMGTADTNWYFFTAVRRSGVLEMYMQGQLEATTSGTARNISYTSTGNAPPLTIGAKNGGSSAWLNGKAALIRISATAPTAEQIAKIYEDEKFLFQENAQATLYGSSDAVTALAHDPVTDLLHVGTSAGRSVFQGLRRVDNTTDAVGAAISAVDDLVVED